jgi:hypothetical protein
VALPLVRSAAAATVLVGELDAGLRFRDGLADEIHRQALIAHGGVFSELHRIQYQATRRLHERYA